MKNRNRNNYNSSDETGLKDNTQYHLYSRAKPSSVTFCIKQ